MAMTQMDQLRLIAIVGEKAILKLGKSYETRKATMALDSQFRTYAISGKTQKSDDQSLDNIAMTS